MLCYCQDVTGLLYIPLEEEEERVIDSAARGSTQKWAFAMYGNVGECIFDTLANSLRRERPSIS